MAFAFTFPGGKLLDKYILVGSDETEEKLTVPNGKRWLFFGGAVKPDTSAAVLVELCNSDDKVILTILPTATAGTAILSMLEQRSVATNPALYAGLPMKAGDYLKITFGAAQGAAAYVTAIVLEADV